MVVDTSVVLALVLREPDADDYARRLASAPIRLLSAGSLLESAIVLCRRHGEAAELYLDLWLTQWKVEIVPVDGPQVAVARRAYRKYGKGRHPAGLNFGDCFAYALARTSGEPLLFKGADFALTDVERVAWE